MVQHGPSLPTPLSQVLCRCRGAFAGVGSFSLVINLLMLTTSVYMMQVYDRVLGSGSIATLVFLTLVAGGALAILSMLDVLRGRVLIRGSAWLERRLGPTVLGRVVEAALAQAEYRAEALRDLGSLRSFLGGAGILALFDAPWVPIYLAVIYLLHPLLGHVALAGTILLFALALVNDRLTQGPLKEANLAAMRAMRTAEAGLRNAEVIDAMGLLPGLTRRWGQDNTAVLALQSLASDRATLVLGLSKFLRQFVQVMALAVGAWLVIGQELTGGAMIAGTILMGRAMAPVEQAIGSWKQAVQAHQAYQRLQALFARPPLRPSAMPLPAPLGKLTVEGITYGVPGHKQPILKGVAFAVEPGEAVAIIGPSAAGKSTLARLLVGIRQPAAGTVRLDGADLFSWNREDVGRHVGYLPQDVELFAGTVRDNIARLGDADPAAVVQAAKLAHAHELILRLEKGYETEIGEQGALLSGGQRQRIALARTFFNKPRLVVLDEPNANLDAEGEEALNRAIAAIKAEGAAVIVIGHRPSILAQVDKILVLVGGQVEQFGPRQEVLERLGRRNLRPVPASVPTERRAAAAQAAE